MTVDLLSSVNVNSIDNLTWSSLTANTSLRVSEKVVLIKIICNGNVGKTAS